MRWLAVAGLAIAAILVGATIVFFVLPSLANGPACGGGVYGAKLSPPVSLDLGQPLYNLTFTKNGAEEQGLYYGYMSHAISWLKSNTPSDAVIMTWWDYGKEIVGCAGRSSVISNPSSRFIALGFSANQTERDPEQSLADVGTALFATNAAQSHSIATSYGAGYLLITVEDGGSKAPYILQYLGLKPSDYISTNSTTFSPASWTGLGQTTTIFRLLDGQAVPGFTQVYSDANDRVFSVG